MNVFLHRLPEFSALHPFLIAGFIGVILALLVTQYLHLTRGFHDVTPALLTKLLNRDNALLIDVSPRGEYEKSHVPGAKHVSMDQLDPEHKDLAKVKSLPVVVCCRSGVTSQRAAKRLVKAGFDKVYMLAGGVNAWRQADLPLVRGKK